MKGICYPLEAVRPSWGGTTVLHGYVSPTAIACTTALLRRGTALTPARNCSPPAAQRAPANPGEGLRYERGRGMAGTLTPIAHAPPRRPRGTRPSKERGSIAKPRACKYADNLAMVLATHPLRPGEPPLRHGRHEADVDQPAHPGDRARPTGRAGQREDEEGPTGARSPRASARSGRCGPGHRRGTAPTPRSCDPPRRDGGAGWRAPAVSAARRSGR